MAQIEFEKRPVAQDLCWPGNRRIAVVFNLAFETWSPGATSGVGPMGNVLADGLFDPNADSYGQYNANRGIARLLAILERRGVPATLMTSGLLAETCADDLRVLARQSQDIVGHGLAQDMVFATLSMDEAERSVARSTAAIEAAIGRRPTGWISPRVTSSSEHQRLFAAHGYEWHGDVLDGDLPYVQRFDQGEILAIPMSVEFNDLPHAMRFGRTPGQFVDLFREALAGIQSQPEETIILDVFAHGHCYGRPAAAWAIDEIAKLCCADSSLWLTTRSSIAAHCAQIGQKAA
ncbi:polysaccharide deacetylase family protein [Lutimaribacter sp. EGI FJ00015]|uniref:Polysaccharide deacetylase family protein n=1 Tax=Lutimaribacter degradans TaxID=2945989 RepID=A0ACC5ZU25_9RHOB|nr:polysaccharide deacetylase family protein [Lutimaribacter sp. EGI FJ00013]MCM2561688.1 polysaccharide deacetylase family protein [Lutimaribacter sp. EGI FJ00013]MCO0612599.1 polysaccharide deacetylase family protein [Lutimaribacter sp. EGI FJ00015]MCO0635258.1 polysaccharide deacetylase family protein [Lutimaribacter sp. EGI FJ00014]